ncbi:translation initiation factor IF-2 [Candidatus Berkelbacteria bacterium RBG_13_40_8]|uniref:Translation initiation factor IF-2 n=1 Tax=Candidatus Berkelbacteria bacterium RBG_13_40_8 TaxID=1797467 RepID=A0A1F5DML3_9BACT|nr:MAG: translation initiation factor IF-2 [Candidatus Berkelbacteria bacterium RBG_13_40_8]
MARKRVRKLSKKEARAEGKRVAFNAQKIENRKVEIAEKPSKIVEIPSVLAVREFAEALNLPVTDIISKLVQNGVMATINELIDFDTMSIIGDGLGFEIKEKSGKIQDTRKETAKKNLEPRPPVVTVMGHVDHGKTKLLDAIRSTDVVATESGGITQHIGAYQVNIRQKDKKTKKQKERAVTFLDTPGHEAFTAMRAHGANITDVVVLVVAANDGVKPQTIEALNHAKAAKVPIVVAINKIDLPDADVDKVKRQLADQGLNPEEWGGDTAMVAISAKQNQNIDALLEMILLVSDLRGLKADSSLAANGVVIESHMQAGMGPVATVLVQEGTLKINDPMVIGQTYGKVRIMENYLGKKITDAGPSTPVRIAGLQEVPNFGDRVLVVSSEKEAKDLTAVKTIKRKVLSITEFSQDIKEGKIKELKLILKADVAGSLEAIKKSLNDLETPEVKINVIHEGVGDISETDINMALASQALVIGFRVKADADVMNLARRENVKIQIYDIIYQLIDDLTAALSGLLAPEIVETELGRLSILAVFKVTKKEQIVGGRVTTGKIENGTEVRIVRDKDTIGEGKIVSLQQNKKDVSECAENFECGLKLETQTKIKVGDSLECYKKEERTRKLGQ